MNNRQIVASLNQIANELDSNGLYQEANVVTNVMVKISQYSGLTPGSAAARAVGLFTPDEQTSNEAISDIKTFLNTGKKEEAKNIFFETLEKLEDPAQREKFRNTYYDLTSPSVSPNSPISAPNAPATPINTNPSVPGKPSQPSSKPGSSKPSAPKSADGLDRWVNKAANIYSAWISRNANPNSSAFGLISDIVDYMQRVKSKLPANLQGSADAKINQVKKMKDSIPTGVPLSAQLLPTPYSMVSGVEGKDANPFTYDPSKRLTGRQLDYQADYESKRY